MAYELNWSFKTNVLYAPVSVLDGHAYSWWWLASCLIGGTAGFAGYAGNWTLFGSGNPSGAGLDTTDRLHFNGAYTLADWTRAAAEGTNHTWFVLKSPTINGSNWYINFSFIGAVDYNATLYMSKAAPTGGSTTNRPTATDEWYIGSNATVQGVSTSNISYRLSMGFTTRGDFWMAYNFTLGGSNKYPQRVFWVQGPAEYQSADLYPLWAYYNYSTSGPLASSASGVASLSSWHTRSSDGNDTASTYEFLDVPILGPNLGPDPLAGTWVVKTVRVYCSMTGYSQYLMRGRLQDVYVVPSSAILSAYMAAFLNGGSTLSHVNISNLLMPCNDVLNVQ